VEGGWRDSARCARLSAALTAAALILLPHPGRFYANGPPPAHTGGFGEPTCQACHADNSLNDTAGSLSITGIPAVFVPGDTFRVTVVLRRAGLRRAGFELSARFSDGRQAGAFRAVDTTTTVTAGAAGVRYVHHTRAGSRLFRADTARWTLEWTAPRGANGAVAFHVAANAANDDNSEFGDFIYTTAARTRLPP
jgi:hypothetical protein